jgi:hypothetical protein
MGGKRQVVSRSRATNHRAADATRAIVAGSTGSVAEDKTERRPLQLVEISMCGK